MPAKCLQSCLTLCDPMDCRPSGSSVHRDSPGKNTEVDFHALLQGFFSTMDGTRISYICRIGNRILYHWLWWFIHLVVSDSCNPMDGSLQVPLSMGFSRQEYWSQLPFLSPSLSLPQHNKGHA